MIREQSVLLRSDSAKCRFFILNVSAYAREKIQICRVVSKRDFSRNNSAQFESSYHVDFTCLLRLFESFV